MQTEQTANSEMIGLPQGYRLREQVCVSDLPAIRRLVNATGKFTAEEQDIAVELVQERLDKGAASGYEFCFIENDQGVMAYACYGHIAGTISSYDLYWIAVTPALQGSGLGRTLIYYIEQIVGKIQAARIYVDTSSLADYAPTRRFYRRCGYTQVASLKHFYAQGVHKVIFVKALPGPG